MATTKIANDALEETNGLGSESESQGSSRPLRERFENGDTVDDNNKTRKRKRFQAPVFRGEISCAQVLYNAIKAISSGKKDQHCVCEIDSTGLSFITTDSAAMVAQGCAHLPARLFEVFELHAEGDRICFSANLTILLNCLTIMGIKIENVAIKLAYSKSSEIFEVILVEGNVITECRLRTIANLEEPDIPGTSTQEEINMNMALRGEFKSVPVVNKCIIGGTQLREALSVLQEIPGAATASVLLSPSEPYFRIKTDGQYLSSIVSFPRGKECLQDISCKEEKEYSYTLSLIQQAGKALPYADKTSIRMNERGTLSFQHVLASNVDKQAIVEYYILTNIGEDDEEDGETKDELLN